MKLRIELHYPFDSYFTSVFHFIYAIMDERGSSRINDLNELCSSVGNLCLHGSDTEN